MKTEISNIIPITLKDKLLEQYKLIEVECYSPKDSVGPSILMRVSTLQSIYDSLYIHSLNLSFAFNIEPLKIVLESCYAQSHSHKAS